MRAVALLFVLAVAAPPARAKDGVRMCAEWEPATGVMIAWPLRIPDELVEGLARAGTVHVLVTAEHQDDARDEFGLLDVDLDHIEFLVTTVQSEWTRDYGAHQVFTRDGLSIVDAIYINTPMFRADQAPVERGAKLDYMGQTFPGDDRTNEDVAAALGVPFVSMPAYLTGGNFLVDGHGAAFTTRAMLDENNVLMADDEFLELVKELTGIDRVHVLANTEEWGIQHIDCWLKLLDEETLLVKRAPEDHAEHDLIERNVEKLAALTSCHGRPYEILRIDCPRYREDQIAAYTNALIVNDRVFVPLFDGGGRGDDAALATYRAALPGCEVIGVAWAGWKHFDALHCRTRAVFDPGMLWLSHAKLRDGQPVGEELPVVVHMVPYSGAALREDQLAVCWRNAGEEAWRRVALARAVETDAFVAAIPAQPPGAVVEYFVTAADASGRQEFLPRSAPRGFFQFTVRE